MTFLGAAIGCPTAPFLPSLRSLDRLSRRPPPAGGGLPPTPYTALVPWGAGRTPRTPLCGQKPARRGSLGCGSISPRQPPAAAVKRPPPLCAATDGLLSRLAVTNGLNGKRGAATLRVPPTVSATEDLTPEREKPLTGVFLHDRQGLPPPTPSAAGSLMRGTHSPRQPPAAAVKRPPPLCAATDGLLSRLAATNGLNGKRGAATLRVPQP